MASTQFVILVSTFPDALPLYLQSSTRFNHSLSLSSPLLPAIGWLFSSPRHRALATTRSFPLFTIRSKTHERASACRASEFFAFYRFIIKAGPLPLAPDFGGSRRDTGHAVESRRPFRMYEPVFGLHFSPLAGPTWQTWPTWSEGVRPPPPPPRPRPVLLFLRHPRPSSSTLIVSTWLHDFATFL